MAKRTKAQRIASAINSLVVWERMFIGHTLELERLTINGFKHDSPEMVEVIEDRRVFTVAIIHSELAIQDLGIEYCSRSSVGE